MQFLVKIRKYALESNSDLVRHQVVIDFGLAKVKKMILTSAIKNRTKYIWVKMPKFLEFNLILDDFARQEFKNSSESGTERTFLHRLKLYKTW